MKTLIILVLLSAPAFSQGHICNWTIKADSVQRAVNERMLLSLYRQYEAEYREEVSDYFNSPRVPGRLFPQKPSFEGFLQWLQERELHERTRQAEHLPMFLGDVK